MKKIFIGLLLVGFCLTAVLSVSISFVNAQDCGTDRVCLYNPIAGESGGETDIPTIVGNVIKAVTGIIGSLTLLVFIYGGFMWLTSAGQQEKVKTGMMTMLYATIGLFVIFSSYAILSLIFKSLTL